MAAAVGERKTNCCCMDKENKDEYTNGHSISQLYDPSEFMPLDPTQELIFPPELMTLEKKPLRQLRFKGERVLWIQPTSLSELLELKAQYPTAKLVVGNTEVGEAFA
uniref:Molybdopterin dehydrogenase FAD-binding domain-containing protein n=1 Tax=Anguilla anguilla TaxID=7936 RepID=A0A0E9X011_ANGAN